jgi:serine/threonine protein phosphatase PrpC
MLSHRFDNEEKARVWIYEPWCADCNSNQNCSIHHIYSCRADYTDSVCNGIMLCQNCHRIADGHNQHQTGDKLRQKYLAIALRQVVKSGHQFTEKDKKFLESVKEDLQSIL